VASADTEAFLRATDKMVAILEADDARIPELATRINNTSPKVPQSVYDELQRMMGELDGWYTELADSSPPPDFVQSHKHLLDAGTAMGNRIYATIQGIEAMWNTGRTSAGTAYFDQGRQARDEFKAEFQAFKDTYPIE
jgi:hypothetical protein